MIVRSSTGGPNYASFLQEIEQRFERWLSRQSKDDPSRKQELHNKFEQLYETTKSQFAQRLAADGQEIFRQRCENYPRYLESERMDLERVHQIEVSRIRQNSE